jgi:hypothetical protein
LGTLTQITCNDDFVDPEIVPNAENNRINFYMFP